MEDLWIRNVWGWFVGGLMKEMLMAIETIATVFYRESDRR